jgi:N-methylhydantoinase A/oxoprolinase/acetone carboxylase beta subunit
VPFKIYRRDDLAPGMRFGGPCLVEEDTATTVVDVGDRVGIDRLGSLDISIARRE